MAGLRSSLALALAVALSSAGALFAVVQGRVSGTIRDETGKPVAGVRIVVTLESIGSFRLEATSNEKGEFGITLLDATMTYTYTLEKEGYQTLSETFKVGVGAHDRHDFELLTLEAARARGVVGREPTTQEQAVQLFNEGAEAAQIGDSSTARTKFQEALRLDPELAAAHTALATMSFTEKDYASAVEFAERARARDPGDVNALRILAQSYRELGQEAKAEEVSQALNAIDPSSQAMEYFAEGIKAYNAGEMEVALGLFEKSLEGRADFAKTHYMLGMCYANRGDSVKAKEHLDRFIAMAAPDDPDVATATEMLPFLE